MTWASKRRLIYISSIFFVFAIILALAIRSYFNVAPTCNDNKQNGTETGVDCGGVCALYCSGEAKNIVIKWYRFFKVTDGVYNAMAYLENININAGVAKVKYEFKFYDDKNLYIDSRIGYTYIVPNGPTAVFESNIPINPNRPPARVTFEFATPPVFVHTTSIYNPFDLINTAGLPENPNTLPTLTATVQNKSLNSINGIDVFAILYDKDDNVVNVSKTLIESINPKSLQDVYFSWLLPFDGNVVRTEIISKFNPFSLK